MDDYLDSRPTAQEIISICKGLMQLLQRGGLNFTKIVSNDPKVLEIVQTRSSVLEGEEMVVGQNITKGSTESSHVLGLKWDHLKDTLVVSRGLSPKSRSEHSKVTQRLVLSSVSSVFHPIGLVAPFTIRARLLLKEVWRAKGQIWDGELSSAVADAFTDWCNELHVLNEMKVPRSYFSFNPDGVELHVFGDASLEAFGAVAFLRAKSPQDQLAFVLGKARVAPMKSWTIPKLELQAAVLAARLKSQIEKSLSLNISVVALWSDSTTVIQWLKSSNGKQPVFVANRVGEILDLTTIDQWNHVPGVNNPADIVTRG